MIMVLVGAQQSMFYLPGLAYTNTDADDAEILIVVDTVFLLILFFIRNNSLRTLSTGITPPTGERRDERE